MTESVDSASAEQAHTFRRPHVLQTVVYVTASTVVLAAFLFAFLSGGWNLLSLLLAVAELLLLFTHGTPVLLDVTRVLTISPEGIESRDAFGRRSISWWEVQRVLAAEDLSRFRAEGIRSRLTINTSSYLTETRAAIYRALRARLALQQQELQPWPQGASLIRFAKANGLGIALFAAAMILTVLVGPRVLPQGNVLGLRCAYASDYLREKYDLPERHGCVVLRVNEGTGAYRAGLREGDMIVALEGVPVTSGPQFTIYWESLDKHTQKFAVVRPGETDEITFKVTLGGHGRLPEYDPEDPYFFYLRARGADDTSQAITDFTEAIELDPKFDLAYVYRGALYNNAFVPDLAIADLDSALRLDPELTEAHRERARHHIFTVEYDAAVADAETAIDLDGCIGAFQEYNYDCHLNHISLALAYGERGDAASLARGVEEAERASAFYPERPRPYYLAAYYLASLEDYERARAHAVTYLQNAEEFGEPGNLIDWAQRLVSGEGLPDQGDDSVSDGAEPSALLLETAAPQDIDRDGDPSISAVRFAAERTTEPPGEVRYLTPDRDHLWAFFEFDNAADVRNIYWEWSQNSEPQPAGFEAWPGINKGRGWIRLLNRFPNENNESTLLVRFDDEQPIIANFHIRDDPFVGPITFSLDPEGTEPLLFYTGEPRQVFAHFDYIGELPTTGLTWSADKDGAPVAGGDIAVTESGGLTVAIAFPGSLTPGVINVRLYLDGKAARNGALAVTTAAIAASPPFDTFVIGLEPDGYGGLTRITRDISRNSAGEFFYKIAPLRVPAGSTFAIAWFRNREPFLPPEVISHEAGYESVLNFVPGSDGYLEPGEYQVIVSLDTQPVYADVVVVR